jgi:S-layer homology domain
MYAALYQMQTGGGFQLGGLLTVPASVGCGFFRVNLNHQVDASTGPLLLFWNPPVTGNTQKMTAMRVYYKLQVSPPPGTATFVDVPTTHLFFQYIEALAAAGITSGCGGGNFCPDAAVTRGQMAVFLAKALGLHWAP